MKELGVDFDEDSGVAVLALVGELDAVNTAELRRTLGSVPSGAALLVDLSEVTFVDSAGLGALIGGIRRMRESSGSTVLCAPRHSVDRLLRMAGVDRIAAIAPSVEAAMSRPEL